jgi:hypothetical protein
VETVLLIDDKQEFLDSLTALVRERVGTQCNVIPWRPQPADQKPSDYFGHLLAGNDLRLVVTDYDLTEGGQLGFFGATVVDWCQNKGIPVADFSKGSSSLLAKEPNMFELRVPVNTDEAAADYISSVYKGFSEIRQRIDSEADLQKQRSPAAALATMLGTPGLQSQLAQYGVRYGGANSALIDKFAETAPIDVKPDPTRKIALLTYIIGHLLVNSVLRFPGPILSAEALTAYLAVAESEFEACAACLVDAKYVGPFSELPQGPFFWSAKVDQFLARFDSAVEKVNSIDSPGELNRLRLEAALGRAAVRSADCPRCFGRNGGFLCPFSHRTVCQRPDCSVVSTVWIPQGARLSRFERDFYDEWAPILGM